MVSLRVCMNLGMLVFLLVSRDTLFCIGKEMERSTVTLRGTARGRRASSFPLAQSENRLGGGSKCRRIGLGGCKAGL